MMVRICPKCKSNNVVMERGDGVWWRCNKCGYRAAIFPEKFKIEKIKNKKNE